LGIFFTAVYVKGEYSKYYIFGLPVLVLVILAIIFTRIRSGALSMNRLFGILSLGLGIMAIVTFYIIPIFIIGLFAMMLGAESHFDKSKDRYGLAGFILGLISVILNIISWFLFALIARVILVL